MGHSLLCMMGFFLLSTVICGNDEDNITHSQDADEEEEQTTSAPPKPTVFLQHNWPQIYSGETVTVRCEIQGGERAQWTYEWRQGHSNIRETSSEYTISRATESDSGGYSCQGRRGSSWTDWSDVTTLTVLSPPKLTVTLQPSWTQIYSGETVTVRCEIQGGEGAQWTYEWRRGHSNIRETSNEYRSITVTESDSGGYSCRGRRGSFYTEWSKSITLTVSSPPKPTVALQASYTQIYGGEIYSGTTVIVRCEIQGDKRVQWTYEWRRGWVKISETTNEYRINRVTESDGGGYSCRATRSSSWTEWSDITPLTVITPPKPTVTLQPSWTQIYSGETVTVRCEIQGDKRVQWTYEWRRGWVKISETTNEYRISSATQSDRGGYSCRGRRDYVLTYSSETITLTVSSKPKAELRADRTAVPVGGSVTLTCSVNPSSSSSSSSGWKYYWYRDGKSFQPVTNGQISVSEGGLYSCRGGRGEPVYYTEDSDSVRIDKPRPVLTVSPSWLSPGASVTLNCQVEHPSAGWSFYWYKAVPDLSEKSSSYELLPDGSGTAQDSYIIHGQTHTAGYVCRAGRGDPEYHTDHSQPKFVWSADVHSAASLTVSPDRVQHFTSDSVSLTCEGNFTEWRVRKFSEDGRLSDCRRMTGSTCNINTSKSDTGVYWCESGSGEFSSAVNITVQNDGNGPILVSPVHPVTEGASVSLSCSLRTQKILSNVFFYHNDKLIQNDTRGELKISAVSKSDEGFYKCQYSGRESAQSWMSVKVTVSGADSSSSPVWLMVGLVCGVSLIIILLLLLYRCRQSKYSCFTRSIQSESHSPGSSTNHGVNQDETHEYNSLQHGTNHIYDSVTPVEDNRNGSDEHQDVTYALIELKNFGKKRKHHKPEQSAVYSEVKTGAAEDSLMYAEVKRPQKEKAKKKAGKSSPAADAAVYSEVTLGSFPGQ
ncbi:unnamed protein product [Oreochromis niloticus]|nr:unnamed protein product [Mustela putorius furo]